LILIKLKLYYLKLGQSVFFFLVIAAALLRTPMAISADDNLWDPRAILFELKAGLPFLTWTGRGPTLDTDYDEIDTFLSGLPKDTIRYLYPVPGDTVRTYRLEFTEDIDVYSAVQELRAIGIVRSVSPDYVLLSEQYAIPNDSYYDDVHHRQRPYLHDQCRWEGGWNFYHSNRNRHDPLNVGVMDSYSSTPRHPEIYFADNSNNFGNIFYAEAEDLNDNRILDCSDIDGVDNDGNGACDDVNGMFFGDPYSQDPIVEITECNIAVSCLANPSFAWLPWIPVNTAGDWYYCTWHGSRIAGIIASHINDGNAEHQKIAGLAGAWVDPSYLTPQGPQPIDPYPGARIVNIGFGTYGRFIDNQWVYANRLSDIIEGINYAGATLKVATMSKNLERGFFEDTGDETLFADAVLRAFNHGGLGAGTLFVFSGGNGGTYNPRFWNALPTTLTAGWVDWDDRRNPRGSYGTYPQSKVWAPGTDIISITHEEDLEVYRDTTNDSGSSYSAPQVAALASLVRANFNLTAEATTQRIMGTSHNIYCENWEMLGGYMGAGRIDAERALLWDDFDFETNILNYTRPCPQPFFIDLWTQEAAIDTRRVVIGYNHIQLVFQNFWSHGFVDEVELLPIDPLVQIVDGMRTAGDISNDLELEFAERLVTSPEHKFVVNVSAQGSIGQFISMGVRVRSHLPPPDQDIFKERVDTICVPIGIADEEVKGGIRPRFIAIPDPPTTCDLDPLDYNCEEIILSYFRPGVGGIAGQSTVAILDHELDVIDSVQVDPYYRIIGQIAVTDFFDGNPPHPDGNREIVWVMDHIWQEFEFRIQRWTPELSVWPDWQFDNMDLLKLMSGPSIADIGNYNEGPEIVVPALLRVNENPPTYLPVIVVVNPDFTLQTLTYHVYELLASADTEERYSMGALALLDVDRDGFDEVIAAVKDRTAHELRLFVLKWEGGTFIELCTLTDERDDLPTVNPSPVVAPIHRAEYPDLWIHLSSAGDENAFAYRLYADIGGFAIDAEPSTIILTNTSVFRSEVVLSRLGGLQAGDGLCSLFPHEGRAWRPTAPLFMDRTLNLWPDPPPDPQPPYIYRAHAAIQPQSGYQTGTRAVFLPQYGHELIGFCSSHADSTWISARRGDGTNLPGFPSYVGPWDSMVVSPALGDLGDDGRAEAVFLFMRSCPEDAEGHFFSPFVKRATDETFQRYQPGWTQYRHDAARKASQGVVWMGNTTVSNSATWAGEIYVDGEIVIPPTSTLKIKPGTRVYFLPNSGLTVKGTIEAIGLPFDSISFVGLYQPDSLWNGIYIEGGVGHELSYCIIEGAKAGITFHGANHARISQSRVSQCNNGIVFEKCCTALASAENCLITDNTNGVVGLRSNGWIFGNDIARNSKGGLFWQWDYSDCNPIDPPRIEENIITFNGSQQGTSGLSLWGTRASLICNLIAHNLPFQMEVWDNAAIQLGYSSQTGLGWNKFYSANTAVKLQRGTMVYKDGNNMCSVNAPFPFMSATAPNNAVGYNYWSEVNPWRFQPPGFFTANPMYDTTNVPLCGQLDNPRTLDPIEESYIAVRQAEERNDDSTAYSTLSEMLAVNDYEGASFQTFTQLELLFLTGMRGDEALDSLRSRLRMLADTCNQSSVRIAASFNAVKTQIYGGSADSAMAGFSLIASQLNSPLDSVTALVDSALVAFAAEQPSTQAIGPIAGRKIEASRTHVDWSQQQINYLHRLLNSESGRRLTMPLSYTLYQNYPNPFNPNTEIKFDLPENIHVKLKIFNTLGQHVTTLVDEVRAAGAYRLLWDSKDSHGMTVASGVYIYQLIAGNFSDAKKMALIR
jgi:hypothetical protein